MTARPRYTPAARDDLQAIADYISQASPRRALTFVGELREHCRKIAEGPRLYRLREEFGPDVRGVVHGAYLILYTARDDGQVVIERIVHGARDLEQLMEE